MVLGDGRLTSACLLLRRGKKKKEQEKQDLHKRVWMDFEDGWQLRKHEHMYMYSPGYTVHKSNTENALS